jgi:hypothetical protein
MAPIPNARKEMFSRCLATGGSTQLECYIKAGYSDKSGAGAASLLARDPMIVTRVEELLTRREDRGVIPESEFEVDAILDHDSLDERWVLLQLQALLHQAKDMGQLKIARDSLADIAAIKGIGIKNIPKDSPNDSLPAGSTINLTQITNNISKVASELDRVLEEATDVTPERERVPLLINSDL